MIEWNAIDFGAVGQGIIYLTLAILAALGLRKGQAKPAERSSSAVEVQGALVDSTSVKQLAAAIEAINITLLTIHKNSETIGAARVDTLRAMVKAVEALAANVHQTNVLTEREEEERARREHERLIHENEQLMRDLKEAQRRAGEAQRRD